MPYTPAMKLSGMKIEPINAKSLKFGPERVSITLLFDSGFELKRTFGNIDDRGFGHIDLGSGLKALLLEQISKSHSIEILLEDGDMIGQVDLQSLPAALDWVEKCADEHARY